MSDLNLQAVLAHAEFKALEKERDEYLTIAGERADQVTALSETIEALRTELDTQVDASLTQTHLYFAERHALNDRIAALEITNRGLQAAGHKLGADAVFWQGEALEWSKAFGRERQERERYQASRNTWKARAFQQMNIAIFGCVSALVMFIVLGLVWAHYQGWF